MLAILSVVISIQNASEYLKLSTWPVTIFLESQGSYPANEVICNVRNFFSGRLHHELGQLSPTFKEQTSCVPADGWVCIDLQARPSWREPKFKATKKFMLLKGINKSKRFFFSFFLSYLIYGWADYIINFGRLDIRFIVGGVITMGPIKYEFCSTHKIFLGWKHLDPNHLFFFLKKKSAI